MLVSFLLSNYLSFREERLFSMKATTISEHKESLIECSNGKYLRSAVLYGANSSGKSNFISALQRMRRVLLSSVKLNDGDKLSYNPFLLTDKSAGAPTRFEIEFMADTETTYRYGFSYSQFKIQEEWLFRQIRKGKETPLFIRENNEIAVTDDFVEGSGKEELTNENRLFLSLVGQLNGKVSQTVIDWFRSFNVISGLEQDGYLDSSLEMIMQQGEEYKMALSLYKKLNLGFNNIYADERKKHPTIIFSDSKIISTSMNYSLKTTHNKYDDEGNTTGKVDFDKEKQESAGSNKVIDLSGPLFSALLNGTLLVVDELDAKLHPLLTRELVMLFNNPETNPNKAQLIFATHDTNLLSTDIFRRDQIWFTEKDNMEQTDLYSLVEFKLPDGTIPRKDSNLEKNYIRGRYGAIPFIIYD